MGHYDEQREAHYDEQIKAQLKIGRKTIVARLRKLADAMRSLSLNGVGDIEEAIEHLKDR